MNCNAIFEMYHEYSWEGGRVVLLAGQWVIFSADTQTKWDLKISLALVQLQPVVKESGICS